MKKVNIGLLSETDQANRKGNKVRGKSVFIELWAQRIECRRCGIVRQANIGFAEQRRTYTKAFERYALDLPRYMTTLDVARHLGVSWDIVKDIQKRHLKEALELIVV